MRKTLVAVSAAVVLAASCSSRPKATIHDDAFVRNANATCRRELPPLRAQKRQSDILGRVSRKDRADTAAKVEKAADGLDQLADHLAAIHVRDADATEVATWLEEWANYTGIGRRYAAAVRTERDSVIASIAKEAEQPVHNIARFARANHIDDCVL